MKHQKIYYVIFALLFFYSIVFSQTEDKIPFRVEKLSKKVLLLTEDSPMENIIVAIASRKGLVVVDNSGSPFTAKIVKKTITEQFGRDDFAYVINTHHHWDHAWGNQVFSEAVIIGHENCLEAMKKDEAHVARMDTRAGQRSEDLKERLKNLDKNSDEFRELKLNYEFQTRIHKGLSNFSSTPPTMSFRDRLTLYMDDITIKLFYFGRAHSGSDILIQIPEEEILLTGDLFLDIGWLPLFCGQEVLDIPRWIKILNTVLYGEDKVKTVIPGHRKVWSKEKLVMWRDYIVNLWENLQKAKQEGFDLSSVYSRYPLEEKYYYLRNLGHSDSKIEQFHRKNIEAFWRQL